MKIIDGHELGRQIVDAGKRSANNMLYTLAGFVIGFVNDAPSLIDASDLENPADLLRKVKKIVKQQEDDK